jgi:hypothetical protein
MVMNMTTGNLSSSSRVEVFGSTPYQHVLTSPSLTGTLTLSTQCSPTPVAPQGKTSSFVTQDGQNIVSGDAYQAQTTIPLKQPSL